jgi:hypothetical protein
MGFSAYAGALGADPGTLVHPSGQCEPLVELELGVAVRLADLVLVVPPGLAATVADQAPRRQAQLLGDVLDHGGGHVLGVLQEGSQVAHGPQLYRPAQPVPRALRGHRPAPRGLVEQEGAGELALIGLLAEPAEAPALFLAEKVGGHGPLPGNRRLDSRAMIAAMTSRRRESGIASHRRR